MVIRVVAEPIDALTRVPETWHAEVVEDGSVVAACTHKHRSWKRAKECGALLLGKVRRQFPASTN